MFKKSLYKKQSIGKSVKRQIKTINYTHIKTSKMNDGKWMEKKNWWLCLNSLITIFFLNIYIKKIITVQCVVIGSLNIDIYTCHTFDVA